MAPLVQHYPTNRVGRTFVSGDWHGCYDQVMLLLNTVNFDYSKDVLYQTGDLANRGPRSRRCLEMIGEKWFRPVRGNHEEELIKGALDPMYNWGHLVRHGARWARDMPHDARIALAKKMATLPTIITVGEGAERFNVFHGEFHGNDAALDAVVAKRHAPVWVLDGRDLIYGRVRPEAHAGLSPSFVGHTIVSQVKMIGSHVYLDTGSYRSEYNPSDPSGISFLEVATGNVWQYSLGKVIRTA